MTDSLRRALEETERRRAKQMAWNEAHGITPQTIRRQIADVLQSVYEQDYVTVEAVEDSESATEFVGKDLRATIAELEKRMRAAAAELEFEEAARLRDEIRRLEALELGLDAPPATRPRGGGARDWRPQPLGPGGGGHEPRRGRQRPAAPQRAGGGRGGRRRG